MKASEIRDLSIEDINEKVEDLTTQQEKLILAHSISQLENPMQINANRKTIARLKTELRSRETKTQTA